MFFLGCMIYLYVGVCFVLPWTVETSPSCFGAGVTNLNGPLRGFCALPMTAGEELAPSL